MGQKPSSMSLKGVAHSCSAPNVRHPTGSFAARAPHKCNSSVGACPRLRSLEVYSWRSTSNLPEVTAALMNTLVSETVAASAEPERAKKPQNWGRGNLKAMKWPISHPRVGKSQNPLSEEGAAHVVREGVGVLAAKDAQDGAIRVLDASGGGPATQEGLQDLSTHGGLKMRDDVNHLGDVGTWDLFSEMFGTRRER